MVWSTGLDSPVDVGYHALVHLCIDDETPLFESALAHMG